MKHQTKKEQIQHYCKILNKGECSSLKTFRRDDFNELFELFKKHPDKDKCKDLQDIIIVRNKRRPIYYEFNIRKSNGDLIDISYRYCISGVHQSSKAKLISAMRHSIQPQIDDYRESKSCLKCELCKSTNSIHIDHIITFKDLADAFLQNQPNVPQEFDDTDYNSCKFKSNDKNFEERWIKYHKEFAALRPLCQSCNLARGRKS